MAPTPFDPAVSRRTLFQALVETSRRHGAGKVALEDQDRFPMNYGRLVLGSLVLGHKLAALTHPGTHVGVMLPNAIGTVVTLFGLSAFGRVPALLNFTAGIRNLTSAADLAKLEVIVTSRRFVEKGELDDIVEALGEGRRVVYLEDVRDSVGILDKLRGVIAGLFPRRLAARHAGDPDAPAIVLFTSGSEGAPKGVVLSHANLLANAAQIRAHAGSHFSDADTFFNPLPVFHSFGLTAGLLLGLFHGMKVVLYPSPLHYRQVPRFIRDTKATILLATDTFLQAYARAAPDDLKGLRYAVAGAERVKEETHATFARFGTTLLEGYGATECSPVIACNLPELLKGGTVGPFLPGIAHRLEPVPGIAEGGRLHVRGPNVMRGYLSLEGLTPPPDGWHDTGDIVVIDEEGRVAIRGRAKRFAKIGGEMVSLAAVETLAGGLWPGATHVAVAVPDARKGERIVLVTDRADADAGDLASHAKANGFSELWVPKSVMIVGAIPVMANGKIDHSTVAEMIHRQRGML